MTMPTHCWCKSLEPDEGPCGVCIAHAAMDAVCECDSPGDGPCPIHWRENQLQDERAALQARVEELEKAAERVCGCQALYDARCQSVQEYNAKNVGGKLGPMALPPVEEKRLVESAIRALRAALAGKGKG